MVPLLLLVAAAIGVALVLSQTLVTGYIDKKPVPMFVTAVGNGARLRVDAAHAWATMVASAAEDGITLAPIGARSGFRTSEEQQQMIDERGTYGAGGFAAAVNASPHQRGDSMDIARQNIAAKDFDPSIYAWLRTHSMEFGWFPAGDSYSTREPWHFEFKPGLVKPSGVA